MTLIELEKLAEEVDTSVVIEEHEGVEPVSYMAYSNLKNIVNDAEELLSIMNTKDDLPQWVDELLAVAKNNVTKALDYIRSIKSKTASVENQYENDSDELDSSNYLFVLAEYFEEKYFGVEHIEHDNDAIIVQASKSKKSGIATKSNPTLWSKCKSEAKSKMGGKHSARAMQLALKLYKQRGGKFKGKKPTAKTNKMKKWTKQKWMNLSDYKKKNKNKADDQNNATGRYLPESKWKSLSENERQATDKKKKQEGKDKQYVPNTEKAKVKSNKKYY